MIGFIRKFMIRFVSEEDINDEISRRNHVEIMENVLDVMFDKMNKEVYNIDSVSVTGDSEVTYVTIKLDTDSKKYK